MARVRVMMGALDALSALQDPRPPCMRSHMLSPTDASLTIFCCVRMAQVLAITGLMHCSPHGSTSGALHAAMHALASRCLVMCFAFITVEVVVMLGFWTAVCMALLLALLWGYICMWHRMP